MARLVENGTFGRLIPGRDCIDKVVRVDDYLILYY